MRRAPLRSTAAVLLLFILVVPAGTGAPVTRTARTEHDGVTGTVTVGLGQDNSRISASLVMSVAVVVP